MKKFLPLTLALFALPFFSGLARANGSFSPGRECDMAGISKNPNMQRALRALSVKSRQNILLNSCYRSQSTQDGLLKKYRCAPYGPKNCNGLVATRSEHTHGVAADFNLQNHPQQSGCRLMDQVRNEVLGGVGGIGGYGGTAYHMDVRNYKCNWNARGCTAVLGAYCGGPRYGAPPGAPKEVIEQYKRERYNDQKFDELYQQWSMSSLLPVAVQLAPAAAGMATQQQQQQNAEAAAQQQQIQMMNQQLQLQQQQNAAKKPAGPVSIPLSTISPASKSEPKK